MESNTYEFSFDTYDELIEHIPKLKQEYNITYGVKQNGVWVLEAIRYHSDLKHKEILCPNYVIYSEDWVKIHEGTNIITDDYIDITEFNPEELKNHLYNVEHEVKKEDNRLLKILSEKEVFGLIDLAIDMGDTERVKILSKYLNKNNKNLS